MSITLRLKSNSTIPIEIEGLTPETVAGCSVSALERMPIVQGNRKVSLAELFEVQVSGDDDSLIFVGDLTNVHWLGAGLTRGHIRVEGNVGRHAGAEMRGGQIEIRGNAGDWAGAEMKGGRIRIDGHAGDGTGGAYRGSRRGMTGGLLIVQGHAGSEVGRSMRRGTICIRGNCQGAVAYDMLAGTILVGGNCGPHPAAGMQRGTLILLGPPPPLLPSFRFGGRHRPAFLPLLRRSLDQHGFACEPSLDADDFELFHGDFLALGRGELLIRAS